MGICRSVGRRCQQVPGFVPGLIGGRSPTSILVRNNLGLVVDGVGDGAVGIPKRDADGGAVARRGGCLFVTHLAEDLFVKARE